ncbi:MAG: sugar ABC transporter ATP-binding protein, partial [Oricola sp.]|nr:sugar ABC transporter ATP-binding protein [Oricola sp.]
MSALELRNISKHFGAIRALNNVSLTIEPGEVVGLMGDNGAGKSTMVKVIAGNFAPSSGDIFINGSKVHFHKPLDAQKAGIEVVYQDLAICNNLSAASNVFLGREPVRRLGPIQIVDYGAMRTRAGELFARLKSETRPRDVVRRMSGGQRQAVAIARSLLTDARIILMDEPTAAISVRQVAEVLNLIRQLSEHGIAVVLISHRMPDVFEVADKVAVLRRAELVASKPASKSSPEEITGLITGAIEAA